MTLGQHKVTMATGGKMLTLILAIPKANNPLKRTVAMIHNIAIDC